MSGVSSGREPDHASASSESEHLRETHTAEAVRIEQELQARNLESMARLAGGVAHEINNVFAILSGNLDLSCADSGLPTDFRESCRDMRIALDRGSRLTRQLLAYVGRSLSRNSRVDIAKTLSAESERIAEILGERITLRMDLDEHLAAVEVDEELLREALLQLVLNARDSMQEAGEFILSARDVDAPSSLVASGRLAPGRYVEIAARDTGCGIPTKHLGDVFEPFFTLKRVGKGLGMGLTTVDGFARRNSGHVDIASEEGVGTTVRILLPAASATPDSVEATAEAPELDTSVEKRATILVVEVEVSLRSLIVRFLEKQGYRIIEESNGREALRILHEQNEGQIDLLLTDIVLPGLRGTDVATRAMVSHPGLRVIFISGFTAPDFSTFDVVGARISFLQKPFRMALLLERVREMLLLPTV